MSGRETELLDDLTSEDGNLTEEIAHGVDVVVSVLQRHHGEMLCPCRDGLAIPLDRSDPAKFSVISDEVSHLDVGNTYLM